MDDFQFNVDLGGMISILSDHLYSSPDVFLRELLQNAADAVSMRIKAEPSFSEPEINVTADGSSLSFTDSGIGLTEEEVHKFISVIGQSSKRGNGSDYIGRFGIGMLSCFIVTDEIVLRSRSVKEPDKAVEWHGFADGRYRVSQIKPAMPFGSTISFKPKKDCEGFFTAAYAAERLTYFGLPLPYPIYVSDGSGMKLLINSLPAKGSSRKTVLQMGKRIFGTDYEFLDYIDLKPVSGLFSGVAYILPFTVSAASGLKNRHRIYLKNMLLTESGVSLLPEWAFFVRCFINTDKLRPTASREDFVADEDLAKAKEELGKCIADYLDELSFKDPALLARIESLHGTALRSVACENERILRTFMPYFEFETSLGILRGSSLMDYRGTVYYSADIDTFRQIKPIFSELGKLLVNVSYTHEKRLFEFAGRMGVLNAQPISESIIEESLLDSDEPESFEELLSVFNTALKDFDCKAVLKTFEPPQISCIYVPDREAETKKDIEHAKENSDELFSGMLDAFEEEVKEACSALYLNASAELIVKLSNNGDHEKLSAFAKILYIQALISGGFPVRPKDMSIMNENLIKLIEWGL